MIQDKHHTERQTWKAFLPMPSSRETVTVRELIEWLMTKPPSGRITLHQIKGVRHLQVEETKS